jgi:hypothetical protein
VDYLVPEAWQPIAILNMLGKVLESVIAQQILFLSEEHSLLLPAHRSPPWQSIDTALGILVQQIHATWQDMDRVTTLLLIYITWAFDRVVQALLRHNIGERKVSKLIVKWVSSLISNKTMTLCFQGYNTNAFPMHTGIPQGSSLLLIIFLFYNATS